MISVGLYGNGMHDFVMAEAELGYRAAVCLDAATVEPDGWFYDVLYAIDYGYMGVDERGFWCYPDVIEVALPRED